MIDSPDHLAARCAFCASDPRQAVSRNNKRSPAGKRKAAGATGMSGQMFLTAIAYHQRGELQRAEHLYREILRQDPVHADALNMLGVIGCQSGQLNAGADLISRAIAINPDNADYHNNLGMAAADMKRLSDAIKSFEQAISLKPRFAEAHFNLANMLRESDEAKRAISHYRKALRIRPDYADAGSNLGNLLREQGEAEEAVKVLRRVAAQTPKNPHVQLNLGLALMRLPDYPQALSALLQANKLAPENPGIWLALGDCYRQQGALNDAAEAYQNALRDSAADVPVLNALGMTRYALNQVELARSAFERAQSYAPDDALTLNHLGLAASAAGDAGAAEFFAGAIAAAPQFGEAYRNLATMLNDETECRALIKKIEQNFDPDTHTDAAADFALGHLHDCLGDYDAAFNAFARANARKKQSVRFDGAAQLQFIQRIKQVFSKDWFEQHAALGNQSGRPVFIVGMPRSGTSLVEQIIAAHPQVFGAGELTFFPAEMPRLSARFNVRAAFPDSVPGHESALVGLAEDYLGLLAERDPGAARVSDKMPYNFLYLGVIGLLFPHAHILHCRRDPVATCFSLFTHDLAGSHPYSYAFEDLVAAFHGYQELMSHWHAVLPNRVFDVSYEQLVNMPEGLSREILAYLELPWDDACLRYFDQSRAVTTASQWQVRQPIYTTSSTHWQNYAQHLDPLIRGLSNLEVA